MPCLSPLPPQAQGCMWLIRLQVRLKRAVESFSVLIRKLRNDWALCSATNQPSPKRSFRIRAYEPLGLFARGRGRGRGSRGRVSSGLVGLLG